MKEKVKDFPNRLTRQRNWTSSQNQATLFVSLDNGEKGDQLINFNKGAKHFAQFTGYSMAVFALDYKTVAIRNSPINQLFRNGTRLCALMSRHKKAINCPPGLHQCDVSA